MAAFTRADPDALVALLRADVELETPPVPTWFTGRGAVVGFLGRRVLRSPDLWRMVPTSANGQHALVAYQQAGDGRYTAYGVQVLTLIGARIARITSDLCFPRESPSSRDGISYWRIVA